MADLTISQTDLANLAKKLDEIGDVLSEKERSVLLAIFKLAGLSIASKVQGADSSQKESGMRASALTRASLSEGFKGAFQSIGAADFSLRNDINNAAGGVGIGVVW